MDVEVTAAEPTEVEADVLALAAGGLRVRELDRRFEGRLSRAAADADPVAVLPVGDELPARRVAVVALDGSDPDDLQTAAARAVRAQRGGGTLAWALDESVPVALYRQVRAVVEGAVLGGYDAGRFKTGDPAPRVDRLVVCGASEREHGPIAARAELFARWTNVARELVDGPPNVLNPAGLAARAAALPGVDVEVLDPIDAGLPALAAVGGSSAAPPRLIVLRHEPADAPTRPRIAFVGKAVTFDAGGYFLKPQSDIVRQKGDMGGGAAVLAALGAIAELGLPLNVIGVLPACENMIGPGAIRPSDVITTAAGLTVEVTNPDAEGRLILADALWYARGQGATHVVDLATLTGAMKAGMGDLFGGVFANDENWQQLVVDAGNAAGDLAWPWPLHRRYRRLLESRVADLRNTSGRPYGYPITAAAFLEHFAGQGPWAHVDMLGPALLDDDRGDAVGPGASGYGVRMLVELASRLATTLSRGEHAGASLEAFRSRPVA
ncbi:MAG TPA: leucyl aminopeptidase family protein [Baekduia sp.]